jgi:hypothetical protein
MIDVVIVYDRTAARVLEQHLFSGQPEAAFEKRLERERAFRTHQDVEVVLLNAASLDDLRVSHARYFDPGALSIESVRALSKRLVKRAAS